MKKLFLLLLFPFYLMAQIPDYYLGVDFTKTGTELEDQLSALVISTHTHELVYTPEVWNALLQSDLDPDNQDRIFLIYGYNDDSTNPIDQRTREKEKSCHTNQCNGLWVREHVFPKSLGNPNLGTSGAGSDAHHIRAIDNQKNNSRSNKRFAVGEGNSAVLPNGFFYPGDEWKGDVARMMMYMQIRYPEQTKANVVGSGENTYNPEMPDLFLRWNAEDPPSEYELVRNTVLEDMQGNRNPFIDNPYLATVIWGGPDAEDNWPQMKLNETEMAKTELYPNPAKTVLNIKSNRNIESVSFFTNTGSKLFGNKKLQNNSIDVSSFENGSYILIIHYTDKTMESRKVLVKK